MALAQNPYAQYKQQSIMTATPERLLVMLFDGALKFSGQAKKAIIAEDIEAGNYNLKRCQDIMNELMSSLNADYEISKHLYLMYDYINYNFIQANIKKEISYLEEADIYLKELRETWIEVAKLAKTQP